VLMRFNRTDPMAEKYGWMSSLAYALNNPEKFVDTDGRDIKLFNIVKYDNNGLPTMAIEGRLSPKTELAMKDLMKTSEMREYFGQFAKKGDVVGGYTFTENGKLSDKILNINDFSFNEETGNVLSAPGSGYNIMSDDKTKVDIGVVSYGTDKYTVGETLTHETQLHGYKDADKFNGKSVPSGDQDHSALKNQDVTNQGYKLYKSVQEKLEKMNEMYKAAFEQAKKEANILYSK